MYMLEDCTLDLSVKLLVILRSNKNRNYWKERVVNNKLQGK